MKNLFYGLIATLVLTTSSYANQLENQRKSKITETANVDEAEIVGDLIQECIKLWSKNSFNSFYSDELDALAEKEKLSPEDLEKLAVISKNGHLEMMKDSNFAVAYNRFENLKLSPQRFQELVNSYFIAHPMSSQSYNKALIPNKKACVNSAVIASGCGALSPWSCLGWIGVAVHC